MTFTSFLRSTVLASAASASILATTSIAAAAGSGDTQVVLIGAVWWVAAAGLGLVVGRGHGPSQAISTLLAEAPLTRSLPDARNWRTLANRLWPLPVATLGAGLFVFTAPQVAAVAAGFPIIWALSWRNQESAVEAIEQRDGVRFFVERTSPLKPIRLLRTPWFRSADGVPGDA